MKNKKDTYYVQTEEEMKTQLLDLGLAERVFEPGDGRRIEGEQMAKLGRTLAALEDSIVALERRGISLRIHAVRQDPVTAKLPIYHVFLGSHEHWFTTREELDDFVAQQEEETGGELAVADSHDALPATIGTPLPASPRFDVGGRRRRRYERQGHDDMPRQLHIVELHEVRSINTMLADLAKLGFSIAGPDSRRSAPAPRSRAISLRRGEARIRPRRSPRAAAPPSAPPASRA